MGMEGVELVMDLEVAFGIRIPDQAAVKMSTPRHVIDWIVEQQSRGQLFSEPILAPKNPWWRKLAGWPPLDSNRLEPRIFTRTEIAGQVRKIICDRLGVEGLSEDDRFVEDLGMG